VVAASGILRAWLADAMAVPAERRTREEVLGDRAVLALPRTARIALDVVWAAADQVQFAAYRATPSDRSRALDAAASFLAIRRDAS
jgi:hypothetical protein